MASPGHSPGGSRGDLVNTDPLDGGSTTPRTTTEMPPSYSDLFQRSPPPRYAELFPGRSPLPNMHPLVEAMWHNQTISNLPRLPEKPMRAVIQNLDDCSIECLRRVSRIFALFCDEEILKRPHTVQPSWEQPRWVGGPFAWPRFEIFNGYRKDSKAVERQQLLKLLARDWYCQGCRAAQEAPDWDLRVGRLTRYLYCHSCKLEHPACLFSARQRQESTSRRQCIAHEGYLRLCEHDKGIFRWSELMRIRGALKNNAEYKVDIRRYCEDPSHVVSCARTAAGRSGQTLYHANHNFELFKERPMPELRVNRGSIWLSWTAHLPNKSKVGRLTDADLRSRINEVRENCGRFLCPVTTPTQDVPEMRCFDPNGCDCVLLDGSENVEWQFASTLQPIILCRINPARRLFPAQHSSRSSSGAFERRPMLYMMHTIHRTRLDFDERFVPGTSQPEFWPCYAGDGCLVLDYTRRVKFERGGAVDQQWYQALDPDSYSLTEDEEGFEIFWCRQKECRNYFGRIPGFSTIIRMAECHRSVDAKSANAKNVDTKWSFSGQLSFGPVAFDIVEWLIQSWIGLKFLTFPNCTLSSTNTAVGSHRRNI